MKVFGGMILTAVSCTTFASGLYPNACLADTLNAIQSPDSTEVVRTDKSQINKATEDKSDPLYFIKHLSAADTDKDGILSTDEIFANDIILKNRMTIDANNDLVITSQEIADLAIGVSKFRARNTISLTDKDGDSLISPAEAEGLPSIDDARFASIDKDKDGFIGYQELYIELLLKLVKTGE